MTLCVGTTQKKSDKNSYNPAFIYENTIPLPRDYERVRHYTTPARRPRPLEAQEPHKTAQEHY